MNGRCQDTTAINAVDGTVAGTLALGGKPEFAVADGKGSYLRKYRRQVRTGSFRFQILESLAPLAHGSVQGTFRTSCGLDPPIAFSPVATTN